jgi:hypothetical protein
VSISEKNPEPSDIVTINVYLRNGGTVTRAVLLGNAATTYGYDSGQRYVELVQTAPPLDLGNNVVQISVGMPEDHFIAPPGWYMLSVVADTDVPGSETGWSDIPSESEMAVVTVFCGRWAL